MDVRGVKLRKTGENHTVRRCVLFTSIIRVIKSRTLGENVMNMGGKQTKLRFIV
jgi:hypothetical protein